MENIQDILKLEGVNAKGYGIIGKIAMQDKRLSIEAKAIYAYFRSYAGAGTSAFPGVPKILADLGISENRYYRHFKQLKQYDYIRVEQVLKSGGKYSHNVYTLVDTPQPTAEIEAVVEIKSRLQNTNSDNEAPSLQNDGTVEEKPHLQNEGTGQKTFPSLHFPCTENEGTNINSIYLKLTDIYNNLSFYLNNMDNLKEDERELIKLILSEDKALQLIQSPIRDGRTAGNEGRIEKPIINKTGKRRENEFESIVNQAQLEYCEDALAAEQALRLLYFSDKPLKVNNIHVPPAQVREDLKKVDYNIVNAAFDDFQKESKNQRIRNPVVYLSRCIYNAIWHAKLKLNADMNFEGINY